MEMVEITVERREGQGKSAARKLRRTGMIPAIFYGPKRTTVAVRVSAEEFDEKLAHLEGSHLIRLVNDGGKDAELHDKAVLLREVQRHPTTDQILHVDLFEVSLTERLTVSVPLRFIGKAAGVVDGGILQPILREVEVECLPTEIPDFIEVDVSALGIHEAASRGREAPRGSDAHQRSHADGGHRAAPTVEEAKPAEVAEAAPVEGAPVEGAAPAAAAPEAGGSEAKGKKGGAKADRCGSSSARQPRQALPCDAPQRGVPVVDDLAAAGASRSSVKRTGPSSARRVATATGCSS
jgi:large subunit ribosomal protein L25